MTGQELKQKLRDSGVNLAQLAEKLNITPQGLNSRFLVKSVKLEYLEEINAALGKNIFPVGQENLSDGAGIPIYDIRACAGNGIGLEETEKVIEYVNIPTFRGCYGLQVYGDSMRGKYNSGDTVFVRPCTGSAMESIEYGRAYVVITTDDILIKMLYQSRTTNHIRLCSYNPDLTPSGERAYPDREIHVNDIRKLYKIVGRIEHEII